MQVDLDPSTNQCWVCESSETQAVYIHVRTAHTNRKHLGDYCFEHRVGLSRALAGGPKHA